MSLKVDLHCHSRASDGSLSCQELIDRAVKQGIDMLALTDHDTTVAHAEAATIVNDLTIKIIPAVEISAITEGQGVHIVGLNIDLENEALQDLLANNRSARKNRATKILKKLQNIGFGDLTEPLNDLVTGDVVCRSHLAQLLCNEGIVKNFQKAFKQFLGKNSRAWVPVQWPELSLVIERIKSAGGDAVLAHPTKYKLSNTRLGHLIEIFAKAGGDAIELAYPGLNPSGRALMIRHLQQHQLAVSQGSDFHHPGNNWSELGAFSVNPASFRVIWQNY